MRGSNGQASPPPAILACVLRAMYLCSSIFDGWRGILLSSQLAGHRHCYGSPLSSSGAANPRSISLRLHKTHSVPVLKD
jgi:hypothetical protein